MTYGIVINRNRPEYTGADGPSRLEGTPEAGRAAAEPVNEQAVLALLEYRALEFAGRAYRVPPIDYIDGVRLQRLVRLRLTLDGKTPDESTIAQYETLVRDIVRVCGPLLLPMGWRRWVWRLMGKPNPLKRATEAELGAVLDFLFRCRMTGRVRLQVLPTSPRART